MGSRIKENPESTFEVYLEVTFQGTQGTGPEVVRQYPVDYNEQETLQTVPKFCFPFSIDSLTVNHVGQNFTFVLTDIESKQRFGFCRLSSGAHSCYCIVSYLPWFEVFYKLLNILADYTVKSQVSHWQELLVSLHTLPIPEPGVPVHLSVHSYFTVPDKRELPSIPENRNLTEYFVAVDVNNMLHLYASMLYERRILVCCSKLSTLTACIHGSAAMLYPMYWQHVYIPVLPQHLIDYCCAPMPYLIGVHTSLMEKVRGMALDDVVLLNVDTNTLETPFDDLQSLPYDVVSSLKNRLKKVSTTTGNGVARAFLKSQAALFGSYRSALQIVAGEPITFSEETFISHRSSAMRQFLQNAIQLQLFKQFIDGRLDLLNAGEGFSDDFEEEINMGEYAAGSDKTYHQWLFTVKKGGGAILNTVKTKANPAMKTVYKFAKDHARMGIKEVKSRLKQKEHAENGYSTAGTPVIDEDPAAAAMGGGVTTSSSGAPRKDGSLQSWEDGSRSVTMHLGPTRPPLLMKRPGINIGLDPSPDQPQPYRSLKEAESMEGEEPGVGAERHTAPSSPTTEKFSNVNLLGDIFNCQDEPENQSVSLAKSLEDLRTPKSLEDLQAKFTYQRMDLNIGDRTRTLPGLKLSNPYNKLWAVGPDDGAGAAAPPWDPSSVCGRQPPPRPPPPVPRGRDTSSPVPDAGPQPSTPSQGNITVPRPQGRKTPEPCISLVPPAGQPRCRPPEAGNGMSRSGGQEFRHALGMSDDGDLLKSTKADEEADDLLSLLDPLSKTGSGGGSSSAADARAVYPGEDSEAAGAPLPSDKPMLPARPYPQGLPPFPPHPSVSLNPFAASIQYTSPQTHYSPRVEGNPFGVAYGPPAGGYARAPPPAHMISTLPGFYRHPPPGCSTLPASFRPVRSAFPSIVPSLPHSSASNHSLCSLVDPPCAPSHASNMLGKAPMESREPQDPFGELLTMVTKPAEPHRKKVEDLRRRWETFD